MSLAFLESVGRLKQEAYVKFTIFFKRSFLLFSEQELVDDRHKSYDKSSGVFEQVGGSRNNWTNFKCTLELDWTEFTDVDASY